MASTEKCPLHMFLILRTTQIAVCAVTYHMVWMLQFYSTDLRRLHYILCPARRHLLQIPEPQHLHAAGGCVVTVV